MLTRPLRAEEFGVGERIRLAVGLALVAAALWAFGATWPSPPPGTLGAAETLALWRPAAALALALIGLAASARCEGALWRLLAPPAPGFSAGLAAAGVGPGLGVGAAIGLALRWRMLREWGAGPARAALATALVAAARASALSVALAALSAPSPAIGFALAVAALLTIRAGARSARARAGASAIAFALADYAAMALAFGVLAPEAAPRDLAAALAALSDALFAGPGGGGVAEAILAGLPERLSAVDALRISALFGAAWLAPRLAVGAAAFVNAEAGWPAARLARGVRRMLRRRARLLAPGLAPEARMRAAMSASASALAELAWAGDRKFLFSAREDAFVMFGVARGVLVCLGDPVGPRRAWPELLDRLIREARGAGLVPALYATGPEMTALARARGLRIVDAGEERVVDLADEGALRAGEAALERAERIGLALDWLSPGEADLAALSRINGEWTLRHGCEPGFFQARFEPALLRRLPIVMASRGGRIEAFAAVMRSGDGGEWAIAMMRAANSAPAAAPLAIAAAVAAAAREDGARRLRLCPSCEEAEILGALRRPCAGAVPHGAGFRASRAARALAEDANRPRPE